MNPIDDRVHPGGGSDRIDAHEHDTGGGSVLSTSVPAGLWEPVASKRFAEDARSWTVGGLDEVDSDLFRVTIRQNNHADGRANVRLNLNGDRRVANYEAVEAYVGAGYSAGDRLLFDGLAQKSGWFARARRRVREALPDWQVFRLFDPGWRVLRGPQVEYMNFGKPLPGENAVFGQGLLSTAPGGTRSLIRQCAEKHPKGHLLTVGRYTYTEPAEPIDQLQFTSSMADGLGRGSLISIEGLAVPEPTGDGVES